MINQSRLYCLGYVSRIRVQQKSLFMPSFQNPRYMVFYWYLLEIRLFAFTEKNIAHAAAFCIEYQVRQIFPPRPIVTTNECVYCSSNHLVERNRFVIEPAPKGYQPKLIRCGQLSSYSMTLNDVQTNYFYLFCSIFFKNFKKYFILHKLLER